MNYPLISEYVEAIKAAEDNFDQLKHLRPVLGEDGEPVMTSGNFAVVFKVKDEQTGKLHAVKCFLKEQEGRAEAYRQIAEELEFVSSTFLTPIKYLDKELFVDSANSEDSEFPVLLMDWVEGQTLDKYIREHIDDQYELSLLAYQFSRLAMWLMPQPFAHGDLKPDNILVKEDGTLVLVDYDGMYVPAMKGQKARELGSPDFRHPNRTETDFDEHIDDFSLISILVSLKAIAIQPRLLEEYGASDRLLFSQDDYRDLCKCRLLKELYPSDDPEFNILLSLYTIAQTKGNLFDVSSRLLDLPKTSEILDDIAEAWLREMEEERAPYEIADSWPLKDFIKRNAIIGFQLGVAFYSVTDGGEDAVFFRNKVGKEFIVFNQCGLTKENIVAQKDDITIELRKSGHYIICGYSTKVSDKNLHYAFTDELGIIYSDNKTRLLGLSASYLSNYEIPEGVEIICDDAFNSVWREEDSEFLPYWRKADDLFIDGTITIPSSVRYIGRNPFRGDYKSIICNSPHFIIEDDALFTANKKRLISCFSKQHKFIVPEGVEQIGSFAFKRCDIECIIIPESVSYIGDNPFIEMNLTNEKSLDVVCNSPKFYVKGNAIYQKNPQKILSYWGETQMVHIENGTITITPYSLCKDISRICLPNSIQEISDDAFGTDLQEVLIPIGTKKKFEEILPTYKNKLFEMGVEEIDVFSSVQTLDVFMKEHGNICGERWRNRRSDGVLYREVHFENAPQINAIVVHQLDSQSLDDIIDNSEKLKVGHFIEGGYAVYRTWVDPSKWEDVDLGL